MGFWTGIKKALNSTAGTPNFKPLDNMIADVKNTVIGQRTLAASDSVIKVIVSSPISGGSSGALNVGTFIPRVNGSVRVQCTFENNRSNPVTLSVIRLTDSRQVASHYETVDTGTFTWDLDLPITKDITYGVYINGSYSVTVSSASIRANIIDTSLIG